MTERNGDLAPAENLPTTPYEGETNESMPERNSGENNPENDSSGHQNTDKEGSTAHRGDVESPSSLCASCKQKERDTAASPHAALCAECRQQYIRLRVPRKIKVLLAVMCVVLVGALVLLPFTFSQSEGYLAAQRHMKNREYVQAYRGYLPALENQPGSVPIILSTIRAAMNACYFDEAADVLNEYLVGKDLSDSQYTEAMGYVGFLERYYEAGAELETVFTEVDVSTVEDAPTASALLIPRLLPLLENPAVDTGLIYFYLGTFAPDTDAAITYFRSGLTQKSTYNSYIYPYLGTLLRREGKLDEAEAVFIEGLDQNADNALCLRGLSILALLRGETAKSVTVMENAYALEPYDEMVLDSYIIALCEDGQRHKALTFYGEATTAGYEPDEELQAYLSGTMTSTQYYGMDEVV